MGNVGRPKKQEEPPKLICVCCGSKNQNNFYLTSDESRSYFGKIPYCKDCVKNKIYPKYLRIHKAPNLAIYYLCRKIDIPYIHTAYLGALETIKNPNATMYGEDYIVQAYMQNIAFAKNNGWGTSFDDSKDEDKVEGIVSFAEVTKVKSKIKNPTEIDTDKYEIIEYDTDELIQKWGNYHEDSLSYLETEYLDWKDKLGGQIDDKGIDELIKQICYQTLEIRNDRLNDEDTTKKTATLISLMNNSNLIDKQKETKANIRCAGQRIEDIERTRPVRTVDAELSDVDNMERLLIGYIGTTARALGKENYYTKKFDEIYKDYSIDIIENNKNANIQKEDLENILKNTGSDGVVG